MLTQKTHSLLLLLFGAFYIFVLFNPYKIDFFFDYGKLDLSSSQPLWLATFKVTESSFLLDFRFNNLTSGSWDLRIHN